MIETKIGQISAVHGHPSDPDPSPLNDSIAESPKGRARVRRPAVRIGRMEGRIGKRGRDTFVEVSWDKANNLIAAELNRVINTHGSKTIFAGAYG